MHLFATKSSNTVDLVSPVVLFHLNTARHVKCLRKMIWQGMWHVQGGGKVQTGFGAKFEGQRPYRRPMHRRNCNIKMDLKELSWEGLE